MRIVVFGTGTYYKRDRDKFGKESELVAFLDNNADLQGQILDGIPIYAPEEIYKIEYDVIVLMAIQAPYMKKQLLELGISEERILYFPQYYRQVCYGKFFYCGNLDALSTFGSAANKKKVLVMHTYLSYNGGSMAAVYACKALQKKGYYTVLAAPGGNASFIKEAAKDNVTIAIYPALPYLQEEDLDWIKEFDAVIVNVFHMIQCACEIKKTKPVMWWIHEPGPRYEDVYDSVRYQFSDYAIKGDFDRINICTVSTIAAKNFHGYYPNANVEILPYGIPDEYYVRNEKEKDTCIRKKMVFAIIGQISIQKAQKLFVEAAGRLSESEKSQAEFWIIGRVENNSYGKSVQLLAGEELSIKICGQMSREEMLKIYEKIDVVVCPSMEETMSIVLTEGMMHGKLCISSDATGMADYIENGKNGFICKAGDVKELADRMRWLICNQGSDVLEAIRKAARQTYEKYFTMEVFADSLEYTLQQTIAEYECV